MMEISLFKFEFKLEDFWVGVFWKHTNAKTDRGEVRFATDIWICFLPCLPLHITIFRNITIDFKEGCGG